MNTSSLLTPKKPDPLKILLMGPPGSTKTTFALQFPEVHIFDNDKNLDGPETYIRANLKKDLSYTWDSIRYDDKGESINVEECLDRLSDKIKLARTDAAYQTRKVFVVDSLSHVNEFIIRKVLKLQGKQKNVGDMDMRDWGPFASQAYQLIVGRLEELKKTVICICHENKLVETVKDTMEKRVIGYEPAFQGKVGDNLGAFFTDVWRMERTPIPGGKYEVILQTTRTPKCDFLKNSVGMPGEVNITKGFSAVEQYLKGKI